MGLLYTKLKVFHFKEKIDSLPNGEKSLIAPIHIRIKPTNSCGHNCWYCAYKSDTLQLGKHMIRSDYIPKDKMLEIVDDIVGMGVKAVTFSGGGDPFCYPYLLDTVKKLSDLPIKFASLTNGANLDGEIAELFAYYGTWIRISIDGWDDESYSSYRRVQNGEFTKVIRNMENFKNLGGKCYLSVSLIVDKKNALHIYEFVKKLKDVGVDSVKVSPCIPRDNIEENNIYHNSIFDNVKEQVSNAKRDFVDEKFEIYDSYHLLNKKFKKDYTWCPYMQILPVIGADLNIYPCQDKAYNLDNGLIGSIKSLRFKEFWFSDKNKFFKINPSLDCNHHCISNEKNKFILEYINADKNHLSFV